MGLAVHYVLTLGVSFYVNTANLYDSKPVLKGSERHEQLDLYFRGSNASHTKSCCCRENDSEFNSADCRLKSSLWIPHRLAFRASLNMSLIGKKFGQFKQASG
ncbi:hypothetical protein BDEG_22662 [Batrachochytrium dendrobatidis JEL423]|uniref:Uncharacterized protein n=1 Tax=Batrachochytrium dendrobatidis (strain JEL423) TaxID=403673 RepID=A0A177WF67_BATDL|nr:hypothetical protein BDEG_22662 [Batrachochytrium dendrobatidis JEL423]